MTNNQWSPAAVQIGEGGFSPAALANSLPSAGPVSCGARQPIASKSADQSSDLPEHLPGVPALVSTRLQLELLLQEPVVDLGAVTEVILADPGATIELFRLAAREWMPGEERAGRVEDALAGIALSDCLEVISGQRGDRGAGLPELQVLAAAWDHARMVALRMRQAAELEDFPHPEQAYLVGLLHELGRLPAMLGWIAAAPSPTRLHAARGPRRRGERQDAAPGSQPGSLLAEEWRLPSFLVSALRDIEEASTRSPWARLVAAAHHPEKQQGAQAAGMSKRAPLSQASPQRSRVLSFTSHERVAWKHGATVRAHVPAPMRPPA